MALICCHFRLYDHPGDVLILECRGKNIQWHHLKKLYRSDTSSSFQAQASPDKLLENESGSCCSGMVLIREVCSINSVAKALEVFGGDEATETAIMTEKFNKFFDCLNVRNFTAGKRSRDIPIYSHHRY